MNRGADIWNSSVRSFPLVRIWRTRSGSWNGSPLRKRSLISEKIAVFAPIPSASVRTAIKVNTGDLRSWRSANPRSFISLSAKCLNRVDTRRAARRNEARGRGDDREEPRDSKINERIERVHFEEDILQSGSGENSEEQRGRARAENKPDH